MKKIICLLIAVLTAVSVTSVGAVKKSAGLDEDKVIEIVGALEIMQGDENGNLNLDSKVTRAEFVKMAVAASLYKDDADVSAFSPFPDVSASHWASGYIRTAVGNGWINGYLDGTFRPSGNVKLEEAVNITLKLLGYTNSDFEGAYPQGQLAKYDALDMEIGISAEKGQEMTRRDCMYLIYNALCTSTKNGTDYAKSLGYTTDAYGNIDYDALVEEKTEGPMIVDDIDSWKEKLGFDYASAKYYKDGKTVSFSDIALYDVLYYSPEFSSVWIYDDKTTGTLEEYLPDSRNPKSVTVSGKSYELVPSSDYSGSLSKGLIANDTPVVLFLGKNGIAVDAYEAELYTAGSMAELNEKGVPVDTVLYRNDVKTSGNISEKSLVYYSSAINSAFVYENTAVGVVSEILPSKEAPSSIKLGNSSYTLSSGMKELFKNESTFGKNDFLTLYLGSNGIVEYSEHTDIYDTSVYEDNGLDYASLVEQTIEGPEIVSGSTWESKIGFSADEAQYYLDGKTVEKSVIRDYDVIYYSSAFKTVWVYSDKATGMVESVLPNTVAPTSVTVGGVQYSLERSEATIAFAGKGKYGVGDTVTLLLGKNGGAVDVIDPDIASNEYFGVSTNVEKKEYTTSSGSVAEGYFVTVSAFDGGTYTVLTDKNNFDTGILVSVTLSDGVLTVKPFSTKYNNVDTLKAAIRAEKFTPDATIVDYYGTSFVETYPSRISQISLTAKNVAYYNINQDGNIDYLVLHDATGELHSYGIIMKKGDSYSFKTPSKNSNISNYKVPVTGAVQVKYVDGEAREIKALAAYTATFIDEGAVRAAGKSYRLSDYVQCYVLEQKYYTISSDSSYSVNDVLTESSLDYMKSLLGGDDYTVKAYADSTGVIRVIVAQKN